MYWNGVPNFDPKEVVAYLKLVKRTAYRFVSEGKRTGFKVGGSWRFKREGLEVWIEQERINNKQQSMHDLDRLCF